MIDVGDVTVGFLAFDIAPVIIKLWSVKTRTASFATIIIRGWEKTPSSLKRAGRGIKSDSSSDFSYTRKSDSIMAVSVGFFINTSYYRTKKTS